MPELSETIKRNYVVFDERSKAQSSIDVGLYQYYQKGVSPVKQPRIGKPLGMVTSLRKSHDEHRVYSTQPNTRSITTLKNSPQKVYYDPKTKLHFAKNEPRIHVKSVKALARKLSESMSKKKIKNDWWYSLHYGQC